MAFEGYIKIGSVKGESNAKGNEGEIEVLSFHWGVSNAGTGGMAGGQGGGKCVVSDFSFVHRIDSASPVLFQDCATGKHHPEALLTVRKAGENQQPYLKYKFTDVMITSVRPGGSSGGGDDVPLEEVSINASKVEYDYWPQKADGSLGGKVHGGWDLAKNVKA